MEYSATDIARALLFNQALPITKIPPESEEEVREFLSTFGLHLGQVGDSYVTFAFFPIMQQMLPARWIKYMRGVLNSVDEEAPVFPVNTVDSNLLKELLKLKYAELQELPPDSQALPRMAIKHVKMGEEYVVFTNRLFEEMGKGTTCAACEVLGGFMLYCGCGKQYHVECCRSMVRCCSQSNWDDVLSVWNFNDHNAVQCGEKEASTPTGEADDI